MDIVVLVKQVPDTESLVQIADDGVSIKTQDIKWTMNPYDELAVEEALQIKEAQGGTVTILTLGLFLLIINAVIILLADGLIDGFEVNGHGRRPGCAYQ